MKKNSKFIPEPTIYLDIHINVNLDLIMHLCTHTEGESIKHHSYYYLKYFLKERMRIKELWDKVQGRGKEDVVAIKLKKKKCEEKMDLDVHFALV